MCAAVVGAALVVIGLYLLTLHAVGDVESFNIIVAELGASPILLHNGTSFLHGFVMLSSMEILIIQAKAELKAARGNCEHFLNITGQKRKMRQTARCAACARKEKRV